MKRLMSKVLLALIISTVAVPVFANGPLSERSLREFLNAGKLTPQVIRGVVVSIAFYSSGATIVGGVLGTLLAGIIIRGITPDPDDQVQDNNAPQYGFMNTVAKTVGSVVITAGLIGGFIGGAILANKMLFDRLGIDIVKALS